MVTAEVVPLRSALLALRGDWQQLYQSGTFEPCVSFEWSVALIENQLRAHDDLWIARLKHDDRVIGIVPLMRDKHVLAGMPVYTLRPIAERYTTHSDLLIARYDGEAVDAFVRAIIAMPQFWDEFRVSRLLVAVKLREALGSTLRRVGAAHHFRPESPSFFLDLPDHFDSYLATRDGKFRNYLKRMEARLRVRGDVELRVCTSTEDVESMYAALLEIERNSWKQQHGTSIARLDHQRGFYGDLCRSTADIGTLHLSVLFLEARPVAHNLGLISNGRYYYLKTSYVSALKELAPAAVARAWLIRSLIGSGVREFDFPAEPYEWERRWTDQLRHHEGLSVFSRSCRSRLLAIAHTTKDRLKLRGKRAWTYVDPKSHTGASEQ